MEEYFFDVVCRCFPDSRFGVKERFDNLEDATVFADALALSKMYCDVVVMRHDVTSVHISKSHEDA